MSQRAENNYRLALYDELDGIITAMRNLAQVEMVRLEKAHAHQQTAFDKNQQALSAFLQHYGNAVHLNETGPRVLLMLGSERGFCGGFNEHLAQRFREIDPAAMDSVLVVGSRLANKLPEYTELMTLKAAVGIDETLPVMQTIVDALLQHGFPKQVQLLYHDRSDVQFVDLLPVQSNAPVSARSLGINLPPTELMQQLQWQYLQQALLLYLTTSLHTENRWRLQQMEGARDHLEELSLNLRKRINAQRQQQIVEEIEVILSDQTFS